MFERNGDAIAFNAVSDLVHGWPGGVIQASENGLFVSSIFEVPHAVEIRDQAGAGRAPSQTLLSLYA